MKAFFTLWRTRPWLGTTFVLACAVTVFFAARLVFSGLYWANHRQMPIQPWMTVGYIARSWDIDPRALISTAGLPRVEVDGRPPPLVEIARDLGVPVTQVITKVETAIAALRAAGTSE